MTVKRPRVTIITKSLLIGYGVDEIVNFLANELSREGFDVEVIAAKNEYPSREYRTIVYKVGKLPLVNEYWNNNFLIDLRSFFFITGALMKNDVVVTVDPMHVIGALGRVLLRRRVVMYFFGVPPPNVLGTLSRKVESIRQILLWNLSFYFSNRLVTNSFYTRNLVSSLLRKKAIVNYHGIDHLICHEEEEALKLREKLGVGDRKLILSVGRFSTPYKGMGEMLKIFVQLRTSQDSVLLLVGRGSPPDLRIGNLPDNVKVLSNVSTEMVKTCFRACDIYCTCSKWEGFNLPLVAAQANGKPIIAYNVGAHSEVVMAGESGFLVENSAEFLSRLRLLVDDESLRRKMGEKARIAVRKFTWDKSTHIFKKILCQTLSES
jgi:glycosyltransferase involved in cell wall biosynthesis